MSKQQVDMEKLRQQSLLAWAQANRQAMHEAVRNTSVNQAPVAAAAGASGVGGGGEGNITGLYEVVTDGNIYSYDDGSITLDSLFPQPAVCCDRGDGSFYYVFQWNATYYFGTFNWSTGQLTQYTHNLDNVAQSGNYPAKSLYLEPGGNLIMADGKGKAIFTNIIRIVPNTVTENAVATVVATAGNGNEYLMNLFTYNGDVWGINSEYNNTAGGYYTIGRYDIDRPGFVTGYPVNELLLYNEDDVQIDSNNLTPISVVQATNSRVYMTAVYYDTTVTNQYDFGVFEIIEGQNGLQLAKFQRLAYINNGADIIVSLFNRR